MPDAPACALSRLNFNETRSLVDPNAQKLRADC